MTQPPSGTGRRCSARPAGYEDEGDVREVRVSASPRPGSTTSSPRRLKLTVAPESAEGGGALRQGRTRLRPPRDGLRDGLHGEERDRGDLLRRLGEAGPGGPRGRGRDEGCPGLARSMPSLVEVWPGAEYHERETFEMLGVTFTGHPDMRGILLPEDWDDIPPLRKDFRSPGR